MRCWTCRQPTAGWSCPGWLATTPWWSRRSSRIRAPAKGMHRFVDPADGEVYVYAQPSITDAPRFMACFDQPDLKAPVTLLVTANPSWTIRANEECVQEKPGRWRFHPTKPIATYLITMVAGPLVEIRDEHDGISLGVLARKSYSEVLERDAPEIFEVTKACLDRFHELFGIRYQFGKYDQAFVPEFSWGAMEFPGCVVFRDEYLFRASGHRHRAAGAGGGHRPRDGPHVVRRPGDHAVVG